jgi:hypothetical protein
MDNTDLLSNDLQITPQAQTYLGEAARWGRFLAIVGFILCGLGIIISFALPSFMFRLPPYNEMSEGITSGLQVIITIIYLVFTVLFFFPVLFLYRFSVKMQMAINSVDQDSFDNSLMNLKSMFRFYGIMTIILLSFYALIFIFAMIGLALRG